MFSFLMRFTSSRDSPKLGLFQVYLDKALEDYKTSRGELAARYLDLPPGN